MTTVPSFGQVPAGQSAGGNSGQSAKPVTDPAVVQLAKAWTAFYGGKYSDGAKLAESLFKHSDRGIAMEAAHVQARCNWAQGSAPAR